MVFPCCMRKTLLVVHDFNGNREQNDAVAHFLLDMYDPYDTLPTWRISTGRSKREDPTTTSARSSGWTADPRSSPRSTSDPRRRSPSGLRRARRRASPNVSPSGNSDGAGKRTPLGTGMGRKGSGIPGSSGGDREGVLRASVEHAARTPGVPPLRHDELLHLHGQPDPVGSVRPGAQQGREASPAAVGVGPAGRPGHGAS